MDTDDDFVVVDAADVRLVGEIAWEALDAITLRLHRLDGAHYVEDSVAHRGGRLTSIHPFEFQLDTGTLLGR